MSLLRRYLLPVFASCVALALGIALGGGPLQQAGGAEDGDSLRSTNDDLRDEISALEDTSRYDASWGAALAPRLLDGRLTGAAVTLVALPGVSAAAVDDTRTAIEHSGGSTVAAISLSDDVLDASKKTYVASVADSSISGAEGLQTPPEDDVYPRLGALLARAYVGSGDDTAFDDVAVKIDAELRGATLVQVEDDPLRRGSLVVVLGPGDHGDEDVTTASHVIAGDLVVSLAGAADALVVSTPPSGRDSGGLLDALADADELADLPVSTVNAGTTTGGLVSTVYAVATALDGKPGDFGVVDGEAVLPPGFATSAD